MNHSSLRRALSALALSIAIIGSAWTGAAAAAEAGACRQGQRGRLLDVERVASYPTAASARAYFEAWISFYQDYYAFPENLPARFQYGFDSYKVVYCTIDAALEPHGRGRPTIASGMLSIPRKPGPLSTLVYLHGTSTSFYDAVSNPNISGPLSEAGESFDGPPSNAIFAGAGFIYVGPDYLGLGESTVPRHRYFHAATEASSAVDLLAAARRALARLEVEHNDKLFTFGFSQGGHAALALHRALQEAGVHVDGTAAVGAVLDVEQWFLASLASESTATLPLYLAYLLLAYDDVYDLHARTETVFQEPYAATVEKLFDMKHYFDDVLAGLPPTGRELVTPSFYARVTSSSRHPVRVRLRQNAVDTWCPLAPVRLFHSLDDEEAPYDDLLASAARLGGQGADVQVRTLSGFDHVNSWIQAMPRAVKWFRSLE